MNSRTTIRFLLIAAGAGIAFSWLLDTVRSGFESGPTGLAAGLVLLCLAGAALTLRRGPRT